MRTIILTTVAVLAIGGGTAGFLAANAQPAPPPPAVSGTADRPQPGHWSHHAHHGHAREGLRQLRNFALIYPQADRKLAAPDVQKIAEAFLLWHGNHTWKVVDVAPTADGAIGFALATPDGSVVARFTMDPHTARVTRTS